MKPDSDTENAILKEAIERFELIQSIDKDNRDNQKSDTLFVYSPGNQWPEDVRQTRTQWKELCLEFNQLKQFVAQVVNDQRQNRPGVRIHPASGDASKEVAEILQGLIRGIEYDSNAEAVYDAAFESAVVGGRGWWRICSEYLDNDGFEQKLVLKPIQDSSSVYADTDYQQPDGSDRNFVFVVQSYSKTEFLNKWPDAEPISWDDIPREWALEKDTVIVADYYRRVCNKRVMVMMSDGAKGFKDEMPEPPEGVTIIREREVEDWSVEWYTIAGGKQILAQYDWPGSVIPVVCTVGVDMILGGKRVYQGLTRHARDAQAMLNFGMTQQAIHLSLTPRAPWVLAEGQNEGYENMWRDANTKNFSALVYRPVSLDGVLAPPPQRTAPSMPDAGWDRWCQMMIAMIKSTIGMYEQSLGQKGNEQSGRAILAREKQGDTATFNFVDNLSRAIALTGRILVEAIPYYYDTERIVHIIGPDDTRKMVKINQMSPDPSDPLQAIAQNDVTVGKYAVTCEAGPSYATKRQETADSLMQLVQAFPPTAQVAGDLIVKSLDIADADIIAERLKSILPPPVLAMEQAKEKNGGKINPQVVAEMQQKDQQLQQAVQTMDAMQQKIQELESGVQAAVAKAQAEAAAKLQLAEIERKSREHEASIKAATEVHIAEIESETQLKKAMIDREGKENAARISAEKDLIIASIPAPPELTAESDEEQDAEDQQGIV